jgi:hypothetical protein
MRKILAPLKNAGINGVEMQSGDGTWRRCHPIYAAFVGDYPEQMLVACGYYGNCPTCECPNNELRNFPCPHHLRDSQAAVDTSLQAGTTAWASACLEANIKLVQQPFWEDLPYTNIFRSITPDVLHQMYQGVLKHLIAWLTEVCGEDEINACVRRLPLSHGICVFHKGITSLSQVTGAEHKQIATFLLGIILDIQLPDSMSSAFLLQATRSLLDFIYLATYPIHNDSPGGGGTLQQLEEALAKFHATKHIFEQLGVCQHFNLPKVHSMIHYADAI